MISTKRNKKFKENFDVLINMALQNPKMSERYAYLAYRLIKSKKVKIRGEEKFLICKSCNRLLIPGKNCQVRLKEGFLTYKCLNCGNVRKVKYDKRI